jgi:chromosome segregation ATPase
MFSPELFLEKLVNMARNSSRLYTTSTDDLLRMALGHELKGLLLNYALAVRQRSEVASSQEKVAPADKGLASLEKDLDAAKNKLKGEVKALKKSSEEDISKLAKAHEEELAKVKKDREAAMKTMQVLQESLDAKEARLATLAKDNEATLAELATLRREKESWASEKESLKEAIEAQYDDDFNFALDQVKVLSPDIDQTLNGQGRRHVKD